MARTPAILHRNMHMVASRGLTSKEDRGAAFIKRKMKIFILRAYDIGFLYKFAALKWKR